MEGYMRAVVFAITKLYQWISPRKEAAKKSITRRPSRHIVDMYIENRSQLCIKDNIIERQRKIIHSLKKRLEAEIELHNRNLEFIHSLHAMKCNEWMLADSIDFPCTAVVEANVNVVNDDDDKVRDGYATE